MSLLKNTILIHLFAGICIIHQTAIASDYMTFDSKSQSRTEHSLPDHASGKKLHASEIFARAEPAIVVIVLKYKGEYVGHGSGFFVKSNGYILTNNHVIDVSDFGQLAGEVVYEVVATDGRRFTPQIIKTDPELDVALLKVTGSEFPCLQVGDAGDVKVGDEAFIIGTPIRLEFSRSLCTGIVSGLTRDQGRIQTNAIIHGGNSGGPAFNDKGDVIGIAVAVAAGLNREKALVDKKLVNLITTQQYFGISYLIPINYAKNLLNLAY